MAGSVAAIVDGFNYQAFWFWWHACELLSHAGEVTRVGFEVDEYAAFDDVAAQYAHPIRDGGELVTGRFYSIKYSVNFAKEISAESLGDPALINADAVSLLERLQNAVTLMEKRGDSHLFVLVAPWGLASNDPIQKLLDTSSGRIRLDVLFDGGGPRSVMGKLRSRWTQLLGLKSEEELRPILSRFRIDLRPATVEKHKSELSILLSGVGLAPIHKSEPVVQYFPLVYELRKGGSKWFDAKFLKEECGRQKLLLPTPAPARSATRIGIRSFLRFADGLGRQVDELLCVIEDFDGRKPKASTTWSTVVPEKLSDFLSNKLKINGQYDFHLHCFGSIAFLTGYLAEPGTGISVGIVQRSYGLPPVTWTVDMELRKHSEPGWVFQVETIGSGGEWGTAISVTHDVRGKVLEHCKANLPTVGKVLIAVPKMGSSFSAVNSGTHAFALAEQLKNELTKTAGERQGALHMFWAAPNAFAFYLGQVSRPLGSCRLYEFDFDSQVYEFALEVSPKTRLNLN